MRIYSLLLALVLGGYTAMAQSAVPEIRAELATTLDEISGMVQVNGKLYGINDSGNQPVIYEIDTTSGAITKAATLQGISNRDWEDIAFDGTHIYIADVGNNNGTTAIMQFYKFPLKAFTDIQGASGTIASTAIEVISFKYADYSSSNEFDCEAVLYVDGYLHLFTKNWKTSTNTTHYRLKVPSTPSAQTLTAEKLETFNTENILITGAALLNSYTIALLGYNNPASQGVTSICAVWLFSKYDDINKLFDEKVNKQKISVGLAGLVGQLESITAVGATRVMLANEKVVRGSITIPPRLYTLDLEQYVLSGVLPPIENLEAHKDSNKILLTWKYAGSANTVFEVESATSLNGVYSAIGTVNQGNGNGSYTFEDAQLQNATVKYYRIQVNDPKGKRFISDTVWVNIALSNEFSLAAYPTVFTEQFTIRFYSEQNQSIKFLLSDANGRIVRSHQMNVERGSYSVDMIRLLNLSPGIYYLSASSAESKLVKKLVKM